MDVFRTRGDGAICAPCGGDCAEAGALILKVWMCAGRGVMVHYVFPLEGMGQKLVHIFYKCGCVQDEGDGAIRSPCGGDGAEACAHILQMWMCA